ncbi:hypothetical protein BY458DRAFT_522772 [Sporodiniella umbellata]|nr:hypothetical protein BY458DRAFT_522772 [Sporodiniella umbellata]
MSTAQIFQATYSGVPVYEMLCKGIAVMRRKSDSYLNATQILKVAGFDKPHRTRILEREVQTGHHEKVQGGYGKYQGTWVPFERGKELAELYKVDNILHAILEFVQGDHSPPTAPKHTTTPRAKKAREPRPVRKRAKKEEVSDTDSIVSSEPVKRPRKEKKPVVKKKEEVEVAIEEKEYDSREKSYSQKLLQFFMSGKQGLPALLTHPPRDLDINVIIDDEGHTSLHWASAMARIKTVQTLTEHGADVARVNYQGQTALMRSVLFTNNFDEKSFDTLLKLLKSTLFNIDKQDQTVFHHIASTAGAKGKVHASRYYMESLIGQLSANRSELISILNVQDTYGDTALTIAARIGNKKLIKLLIEAGASIEIANEKGMTSQDYISELESHEPDVHQALRQKVDTMFQQVIHGLSTHDVVPPISEVFDSFAESYESDLMAKDTLIQKKKLELELYTKRLVETRNVLASHHVDAEAYEEADKRALRLNTRLCRWHQASQKETLACLIQSLTRVHTPPTGDPVEESLFQELATLKQTRKQRIQTLIDLVCQTPGKKFQDYKRLISTSCNIPYENVETMLEPLLASFTEEI